MKGAIMLGGVPLNDSGVDEACARVAGDALVVIERAGAECLENLLAESDCDLAAGDVSDMRADLESMRAAYGS